jgi:hypothetical protein
MNMRVGFAGVAITLPEGWYDVTDSSDGPSTLARTEGVGALQFSVAKYKSGVGPAVDVAGLRRLLFDFGESRRLGTPTNVIEGAGRSLFVVGDFNSASELVRVWYVSNGHDVALVTYVAEQPSDKRVFDETRSAQEIVESLEF